MNKDESDLIMYMYNTGNYLVKGTGGYFWANAKHKGCLIKAASTEEVYIIQKLAREGRGIKFESETIKL